MDWWFRDLNLWFLRRENRKPLLNQTAGLQTNSGEAESFQGKACASCTPCGPGHPVAGRKWGFLAGIFGVFKAYFHVKNMCFFPWWFRGNLSLLDFCCVFRGLKQMEALGTWWFPANRPVPCWFLVGLVRFPFNPRKVSRGSEHLPGNC